MAGLSDVISREEIIKALAEIEALMKQYHSDVALLSSQRQMLYLLALLDGIESDDSALENITLGYMAVYQLSDVLSPDMSELMTSISGRIRNYLRKHGRQLQIDQTE